MSSSSSSINPYQDARINLYQNARFSVEEQLGQGSFGVVYRAVEINGKKEFAFKFITSPDIKGTNRELIPLKLQHENIIKIYDAWQLQDRINEIIGIPRGFKLPVFAIQLELCSSTLRQEIYKVTY
jgi:serine/threonine protein kinase